MSTSSAHDCQLALRDPADGSLHSDFSLISISGQVLLIKGRGAILLEPSRAELQKPSSAPRASSKIHARLDDKENGRELQEALQGPPPGGGMWSGSKVARWIAQRNGLEKVHVQRGFEYFRKVRYSPQVPRPQNASTDPSEQEDFRKLSPSG
jgi:hypothetical protein